MKKPIKRYPPLLFLAVVVIWTWIFTSVFPAAVPIDPAQRPATAYVAPVSTVTSPSLFGIPWTRMIIGRGGFRALRR